MHANSNGAMRAIFSAVQYLCAFSVHVPPSGGGGAQVLDALLAGRLADDARLVEDGGDGVVVPLVAVQNLVRGVARVRQAHRGRSVGERARGGRLRLGRREFHINRGDLRPERGGARRRVRAGLHANRGRDAEQKCADEEQAHRDVRSRRAFHRKMT